MIVRFSVPHPRVGDYIVDLPCYQWDYTDGGDWMFRDLGATSAEVKYFEPLNIERRTRIMRFILTDDVQLQLQTLAVFAARFVRDVRFWPDYEAAPSTYWDLDWETEVSWSQSLDNRPEIELTVVEKVA